MQTVIDALAHEYGWSKQQILSLYIDEIDILMECAHRRVEREKRFALHDAVIAACAPHTKDGGRALIRLLQKGQYFDDGNLDAGELDRNIELLKRKLGQ